MGVTEEEKHWTIETGVTAKIDDVEREDRSKKRMRR